MLTRIYQDYDLTIHNRGISGNKIADLLGRLQADVLDLQPQWVSLLIGINDTASTSAAGTPNDAFRRDYQALLEAVQRQAKIVIMTPFFVAVPGGSEKQVDDLKEKIAIVSALAATYATVFIPLHETIDQLAGQIDPALLAPDGVHPSQMGHGLIADLWRQAMGAQQP